MEIAKTTKTCEACQQPFVIEDHNPMILRFTKKCQSCVDKSIAAVKQAYKDKLALEREEQWKALCPPLFQQTNPTLLPCQSAYKSAMEWEFNGSGLVFHGPSGKGKSRCAWLILRREWERGMKVRVMDSLAGLTYASSFSDGASVAEQWVLRMINTDLLFMDDVFKTKLTDSFEGVLFTIIDQRILNLRPTIITTNDTGETLASRMTGDRAEPIIRRLREHSTAVRFA